MMSFRQYLRGERRIEYGYDFTEVDRHLWESRMKAVVVIIVVVAWFVMFRDWL